jgi:predicted enzyme related to lactoylglutathione lyase
MGAMVNWFEIGTTDPAASERFYGEVLGWRFSDDEGSPSYRLADGGPDGRPQGGFADLREQPGEPYSVFYAEVEDVAAVCRHAVAAGGEVLMPVTVAGSGLVFAHLQDPQGQRFGVYTSPAG